MGARSKLISMLLAALPLLATPLLVFALAEGWLGFGGGEKDVLLALPWLIWALIFFTASLVYILKGRPFKSWSGRSALIATGVLICIWIVLYFTSGMGNL